jgi:hypothetical protein
MSAYVFTKIPPAILTAVNRQWLYPFLKWLDGALGGSAASVWAALTKTAGALANSPVYANGAAGIGATLTSTGNHAIGTVGGVAVTVAGSVILVDQQVDQTQNGLYTVTTVGGSVPYVLTRLSGYDTPATIEQGSLVVVQQGTSAALIYEQTAAITTVGSDDIVFALNSSAVTFTAVAAALAAATGSVAFNAQKLTGVADPVSAQDGATKNYVDGSTVAHAASTTAATAPAFTGSAQQRTGYFAATLPTAETTAVGCTLVTNVNATASTPLTIALQPAVPCKLNLILTDANSSVTGTFTIVGTGPAGETIAGEVVTVTAQGSHTYVSANAYSHITSITPALAGIDAGTDKIAVGQATAVGLPIPSGAASVTVYKEASGATIASTPVDETTGTVDMTARTVIPTTAGNGTKALFFWFNYTMTPAGTVASHTHQQQT